MIDFADQAEVVRAEVVFREGAIKRGRAMIRGRRREVDQLGRELDVMRAVLGSVEYLARAETVFKQVQTCARKNRGNCSSCESIALVLEDAGL
jgi:hypothetical protein